MPVKLKTKEFTAVVDDLIWSTEDGEEEYEFQLNYTQVGLEDLIPGWSPNPDYDAALLMQELYGGKVVDLLPDKINTPTPPNRDY